MKTASASRRFHLFLDDDRPGAARNGSLEHLEVPEGIGWLQVPRDGSRPRCFGEPQADDPSRSIVLEPLAAGGDAYLLMIASPERPARVNGTTVHQIAVLRERDIVQPPGAPWTLHVALYMHSTPGRAPEALHDKPCPLCGTIYGAKRIWICPACGTALHDEAGEHKDPLQCLRLCTECPGCRGSLILDGYHHRPEP